MRTGPRRTSKDRKRTKKEKVPCRRGQSQNALHEPLTHALRCGYIKLRELVPDYRPLRASVHETARAVVTAFDVLGARLKNTA